ncbi:MAG: L-serine ammonia-lyase [Rhodocyclaceae bacterium]|nr:L-serine ammonia-lyase [Rhodocyclaceae bacterium]
MSYLGCFDLFKIGIGPSSSHTVGPMRAARRFLVELDDADFDRITKVEAELFGSLAHTGKGHATDTAIVLGLNGQLPEEVDTANVVSFIAGIAKRNRLPLLGKREVKFSPLTHIRFNLRDLLPVHSNGMMFRAYAGATLIAERAMYSIGGGFVVDEDEAFVGTARGDDHAVPYPFNSMQSLLATCADRNLSMAQVLWSNEDALRPRADTNAFLDRVAQTMFDCIDRGVAAEGRLPGGLDVPRRAHGIHQKLLAEHRGRSVMPHQVMDWVSVYAIAVNEENAAGGRVVTAPTNGAAGVVPAVLRYARDFCGGDQAKLRDFFLVASAIGALCKMNASISGAEVGCQGEVGSAAAMAAAGLASVLGASNEQIENAAEIALEHHLGMTCDPIGGLVQIPCIERNAMGAIKAISATSLAMRGDGKHHVTLDQAIETMRRTGADMQTKYKETSLGGLALAAVEC